MDCNRQTNQMAGYSKDFCESDKLIRVESGKEIQEMLDVIPVRKDKSNNKIQ